ncbi:unnamed protein product [Rangifer tarandus platyrhynchus]|uniref:Uncharacterized protein n=1 Tax=Rangifer tarandus platyrhynchus TaxID=3082113 RepID=A0AC59ZLY1_RANTA
MGIHFLLTSSHYDAQETFEGADILHHELAQAPGLGLKESIRDPQEPKPENGTAPESCPAAACGSSPESVRCPGSTADFRLQTPSRVAGDKCCSVDRKAGPFCAVSRLRTLSGPLTTEGWRAHRPLLLDKLRQLPAPWTNSLELEAARPRLLTRGQETEAPVS